MDRLLCLIEGTTTIDPSDRPWRIIGPRALGEDGVELSGEKKGKGILGTGIIHDTSWPSGTVPGFWCAGLIGSEPSRIGVSRQHSARSGKAACPPAWA
jgi:hypothetical protein